MERPELENTFRGLLAEIRERINSVIFRDVCLPVEREQLFCCLDTMEDAQEALSSSEQLDFQEVGTKYLWLYGLLQGMYLQQDALRHLKKVYGLNTSLSQEHRFIRDIRNAVVGHPTEQSHGEAKADGPRFNSIYRHSLSHESFRLMVYKSATRERTSEETNIEELRLTQIKELVLGIREVNEEIARRAQEYAEQAMKAPPSRHFRNIGYCIDKVCVYAIDRSDDIGGMKQLQNSLNGLKGDLEKLDLYDDYWQETISTLQTALDMIETSPQTAERRIASFYLREKMKELERATRELERDFRREAGL